MDNITICEEYFANRQMKLHEENEATKYIPYPFPHLKTIWEYPDTVGYIKLVAYAVIMVGGLIGNLSVIFTVALIKSARNVMNIYVANLAAADALICIVCMLPHALKLCTRNKYILGEFMCKFNPFTQMTCLTTSVLILCAISCDRFLAVFRPLQSRTTEKCTSGIILIIWLVSITVSSPLFFVKKLFVVEWADFTESYCTEEWPVSYYYDRTINKCEIRTPARQIYHVTVSVTLFIVPVLIMFAAYAKILHKLWTSKTPGEHTEASVQAQSKSKKKVLKMVIIVLIMFVLCWMPLQVVTLMSAFLFSNTKVSLPSWFPEFKWFSYYIAYANSFINPFIYALYNKDFRNRFCLKLCCRHRKRRIARFLGENFITKSIRSMNTTLSSLRSGFTRRISKSTELNMQVTAV